jgi:hypothetical protein
MRSLIVLVLVWLALQFGSLLIGAKPDPDPSDTRISVHRVDEALRAWPEASRDIAKRLIADYGMPDGARDNVLWWNRADNARIVMYRDEAVSLPAEPPSGPIAASRLSRPISRSN